MAAVGGIGLTNALAPGYHSNIVYTKTTETKGQNKHNHKLKRMGSATSADTSSDIVQHARSGAAAAADDDAAPELLATLESESKPQYNCNAC